MPEVATSPYPQLSRTGAASGSTANGPVHADAATPGVPTGPGSAGPGGRSACGGQRRRRGACGGRRPAAPSADGPELDLHLQSLTSLHDRPLAEHPDVYQDIHAALHQALAEIDERLTPRRCQVVSAGWTPNSSAAGWRARGSRPLRLIAAGRVEVRGVLARQTGHRRGGRHAAALVADDPNPTTPRAAGTSSPARWPPSPAIAGRRAALPGRRRVDRRIHRRAAARAARRGGGRRRRLRPAGLAAAHRRRGCTVLDRTNVRTLTPEQIGGPAELIVADLSFISLRARAARAGRLHRPTTATCCRWSSRSSRSAASGSAAAAWCAIPALAPTRCVDVAARRGELGWLAAGVVRSPLPGPSGNVEFFLWLRRTAGRPRARRDDEIAARRHDADRRMSR